MKNLPPSFAALCRLKNRQALLAAFLVLASQVASAGQERTSLNPTVRESRATPTALSGRYLVQVHTATAIRRALLTGKKAPEATEMKASP